MPPNLAAELERLLTEGNWAQAHALQSEFLTNEKIAAPRAVSVTITNGHERALYRILKLKSRRGTPARSRARCSLNSGRPRTSRRRSSSRASASSGDSSDDPEPPRAAREARLTYAAIDAAERAEVVA